MFEDERIIAEVIAEILDSIQAACRDYFLWSRGCALYEHGVEALMHVYGARQLFALFASQHAVTVRMEHRLAEIVPGMAGRADLTLSFQGGPTFVIEFKRYFNPVSVSADLARLRALAAVPGCVGVLAGPCFMRADAADWPERLAANLQAQDQGWAPHLSAPRFLPTAFAQPDGWTRSQAIAIRVAA